MYMRLRLIFNIMDNSNSGNIFSFIKICIVKNQLFPRRLQQKEFLKGTNMYMYNELEKIKILSQQIDPLTNHRCNMNDHQCKTNSHSRRCVKNTSSRHSPNCRWLERWSTDGPILKYVYFYQSTKLSLDIANCGQAVDQNTLPNQSS